MIELIVNGKKRYIERPMGLLEFLELHQIQPRLIAVEHNGRVVPRDQFDQVQLREGDRLEILQMMAGG